MTEIIVAGHVCVDLTPALPGAARVVPGELVDVGPLGISLGGCVANTGIALAGLGEDVRVHAAVGDDELGALLTRSFATVDGITTDLRVVPGATTSYSVVVEPPAQDRTFWHHTGANAAFDARDLDIADAKLVHLGYPPLLPALVADGAAALFDVLQRAKAAGATTSLDLAVVDPASPMGNVDWKAVFERVLPVTDIVSPSLDDLSSALGLDPHPGLAEELAEQLLAQGAAIVAISAGASGLLLRAAPGERLHEAGRAVAPAVHSWAGARVTMPPLPVAEVRSTNGAGDAMTAGLLSAINRGLGPEEAARLAVASAASVLSGERPSSQTHILATQGH